MRERIREFADDAAVLWDEMADAMGSEPDPVGVRLAMDSDGAPVFLIGGNAFLRIAGRLEVVSIVGCDELDLPPTLGDPSSN
jgi:hypothetical protein